VEGNPVKRTPKPPKSILDPSFRYVNAARTNIARTFARIRREQQAAPEPVALPGNRTVVSLKLKSRKA
jgi:hypothetical protein